MDASPSLEPAPAADADTRAAVATLRPRAYQQELFESACKRNVS